MNRRSVSGEDFAALHARTFGHVWRILGRAGITREAERCELAQDVYVVAHVKHATRAPAVPELAWIGAIAWNVARRYRALERTRREQPVAEPEIMYEPMAADPSPEDIVGRRRRYLDIMEGVTFDRRVVFEMHEIEGFSVPAIAGALGIPQGTATTRLRLAREDVAAAASRMEAREAHAEGRAAAAPMLLPFGAGAWQPLGGLFDDAPPGMEERVWRDVCRALARGAVVGGVAGGAVGGTAAGFLLGAGTVGVVVLALRLLAPAPPPALPIPRAPDAASVALGPSAPTATSAEPGNLVPPAVVAPAALVASPSAGASAPKLGPVVGIDPDEERLIARAQAAFVRGNADAARAALDEHGRRFPPDRAKLMAESAHLRAKLDGLASPSATTTPSAPPDAGRAPHRLLDVEN